MVPQCYALHRIGRSALAMLRDTPPPGRRSPAGRIRSSRAIAPRAKARPDGLLLLDGPHLVADALAAGLPIEHAVVAADGDRRGRDSAASRAAVERAASTSPRPPRPVMAAVSPVRSPSAIVAIARPARRRRRRARTPAPRRSCVDRVRRPGSRQPRRDRPRGRGRRRDRRRRRRRLAPIRSAGRRSADRWAARCACRSAGGRREPRQSPTRARHGCRIVATAPRGGRSLFDTDLRGATAVLIGGEGAGLPPALDRRRRRARHDSDAGARRVAERRGHRRAHRLRSAAAATAAR